MSTFKKIVAVVLIPALLSAAMPIDSHAAPDEIRLRSGTPVILKLTEEVNSKTKSLNDQIFLEVARDVVIDGKVVIKHGTPAVGTVTWVEPAGMLGRPGKIQFSVDSTRTVDDQLLLLKASVTQQGKDDQTTSIVLTIICCVLFLLMKGKNASFPIGTEVKSYTAQDIIITVQ